MKKRNSRAMKKLLRKMIYKVDKSLKKNQKKVVILRSKKMKKIQIDCLSHNNDIFFINLVK